MDETRELQLIILDIFKYFKKICNENDLKYYAIGGTCIGAVRHNGFIPWDDDLDVAMPIDDYLKLRKILNHYHSHKFKLVDYLDNNRLYKLHLFLKIENINTTFVELGEKNNIKKYKGVYIDIMPICGISKNKLKQWIFKAKLRYYNRLNRVLNYYDDHVNNFTKSKVTYPILKILTIFKKDDYYLIKIEKILKNNKITENKNIFFAWRNPPLRKGTEIYPYDYFKQGVELPFEDTTINCPINYNGYLRKDYGENYMVIPPKEKQETHKPAILNLHKSYMNYQMEINKERRK